MSRIAFFGIPAHGHTNPTLGVVRELTARGHQVIYYSYEPMREKLLKAGAQFVACDAYHGIQPPTAEEGARIGGDLAFSIRVLVEETLAMDEMVCSRMQELRPDCIVGDSLALWAKAVAGRLGIPFVSSTTTFAFNRDSARILNQGAGGFWKFLRALPEVNRQIKRLQARGYPIHHVQDLLGNDPQVPTIVYTSRAFQPCGDTFPEGYSFVGPIPRPAERPFRKERETLLYLSMGTVNNVQLPLYRRCIEALREWDAQVVLSVGQGTDPGLLGPLPEQISVYPQVDQIAVLEQADAFLTHCGMNSVHEALYHGVPLVLLPQTAEQEGVARRVEQLGAGLRLRETTPEAIGQALRTVLEEPDYRVQAERLAADFHRCSGASGAADRILSACGQGSPDKEPCGERPDGGSC